MACAAGIGDHALGKVIEFAKAPAMTDGQLARPPQEFEGSFGRVPVPPARRAFLYNYIINDQSTGLLLRAKHWSLVGIKLLIFMKMNQHLFLLEPSID